MGAGLVFTRPRSLVGWCASDRHAAGSASTPVARIETPGAAPQPLTAGELIDHDGRHPPLSRDLDPLEQRPTQPGLHPASRHVQLSPRIREL